ncbi:MAG TPA: hypothetical protein VIW95_10245 [Candidatus Binatus sp.]|uniref:hypothetical protein n=1 Tax=Candidatus Binatus sp. TaxID=2811406 RepID=UPI002F3F97FA
MAAVEDFDHALKEFGRKRAISHSMEESEARWKVADEKPDQLTVYRDSVYCREL